MLYVPGGSRPQGIKSLVQTDFPLNALSKHKQNPNLKQIGENSSQSCHFVKQYFLDIRLVHENVQCAYIA